jgi:hypothetical protein
MTTILGNRRDDAATSAEKTHSAFQLKQWLIGDMEEMCIAAEIMAQLGHPTNSILAVNLSVKKS